MNALSERMKEQCKRDNEVINEHLDMLVELLQGYKVEKRDDIAWNLSIL